MLGRAQALFDTQGKITAWFGTLTDIEEGIALRTQLAETTRNLRRVIDSANVTLICVDTDLKILFVEGGGILRAMGTDGSSNGESLDEGGHADLKLTEMIMLPLSLSIPPLSLASPGTPLAELFNSPTLMARAYDILGGLESARLDVETKTGSWIGCQVCFPI